MRCRLSLMTASKAVLAGSADTVGEGASACAAAAGIPSAAGISSFSLAGSLYGNKRSSRVMATISTARAKKTNPMPTKRKPKTYRYVAEVVVETCLDLAVTLVDNLYDGRMREAIGTDVNLILPLAGAILALTALRVGYRHLTAPLNSNMEEAH